MKKLLSSFLLIAVLLSPFNAKPAFAQRFESVHREFQTIPVASLLNPDGTLNTMTGARGALDLRGWDVTLDSNRGPVLSPQQQPLAVPLSSASGDWYALPNNGLNSTVSALAVSGTDLYVGGVFTQTKDGAVTNLNNIAKFDTSTSTWSALPHKGLNNYVNALAVIGTNLYVGGAFTQTADSTVTNLNNIARFDTSTGTWSALPHNGLGGGAVYALAVIGTDLYVGGGFNRTFDNVLTNLWYIAKFDGTNWSAAPHGGVYGGGVFALAVIGTDLYVGGVFQHTWDNAVTNLNQIAKLDTSTGAWSALPHGGMNDAGGVRELAVIGTDLYIAGQFSATYDGAVTNLNHIARFDTSANAWSALPHNGLNGDVGALGVMGTDLYVGGFFFSATFDGAVTNLNNIAKFDGANWSALPHGGLNGAVQSLTTTGTDLYVGGDFSSTADGAVQNLWQIAKCGASSPFELFLPLVTR